MGRQSIEPTLPEVFARGQPRGRFAHGFCLEVTTMHPTIHCALDKFSTLENANVFRHRRQRHVEGTGQLPNTGRTPGKGFQERPSGGVGESGEDPIELFFGEHDRH